MQDAASVTAAEYFAHKGVSDLFTNELTSAATQVNYGTAVSRLHGVGALVSLAATGAVSVRGGNRQIFEQFVARSGARLRLGENAKVEELLKLDAGRGARRTGTKRTATPHVAGGESVDRARWVVKTASGIGGGTYDVSTQVLPPLLERLLRRVRPVASSGTEPAVDAPCGKPQAVILAAPYHQTGIHFVNSLAPALIPKQPYVCLYVTFVITK